MQVLRIIRRFFTHRPVVSVNTYKVKSTDLKRLRDKTHEQLARELGKSWKAVR
jgi:hypothetical protein